MQKKWGGVAALSSCLFLGFSRPVNIDIAEMSATLQDGMRGLAKPKVKTNI
ncbi:MAG: hypothetical protein ACI9ZF_002728 [Bradyrhizobium sp.]|jgi:hypothetical protein